MTPITVVSSITWALSASRILERFVLVFVVNLFLKINQ